MDGFVSGLVVVIGVSLAEVFHRARDRTVGAEWVHIEPLSG